MKTSLDSTEETCNEICRCSVIGNTSLFQSDIAGSCPVTDSSERTSLSMRSTAISRWQSDMCIQTDCDQRVFDERKWELSLQHVVLQTTTWTDFTCPATIRREAKAYGSIAHQSRKLWHFIWSSTQAVKGAVCKTVRRAVSQVLGASQVRIISCSTRQNGEVPKWS